MYSKKTFSKTFSRVSKYPRLIQGFLSKLLHIRSHIPTSLQDNQRLAVWANTENDSTRSHEL